ncbi:hypothetical protein CN988_24220 [Bacillus thuringiensis]|uniref:HU family DNA-binding protein n=1 Tax=Bacillus thuringiensis TaxID=1428 RepID=UPI000BED99B9|nr:HU family DNA-binding protein [Bacillus thuringiensis]MED3057504.1 HU family DNA-binding protein [Bacillus thuringiensis]PDX92923.1 hypothetical protein COM78_21165 [Bacillus thuringiensis]PEA12935.1 hypothetical protein CON42_24165 [Bacillus thuringiensis]PES41341.1 hypothetical protein CN499_30390 [Bacillus thuringiensis]PEV37050.1 hypothetical protein CN426_28650 [Bacillus thuringiensis]
MNKTELTKVVAEKTELTQKEAVAATQAVLDTIINALANKEDSVHLKCVKDLYVQDVTHKQVKKCKSLLENN